MESGSDQNIAASPQLEVQWVHEPRFRTALSDLLDTCFGLPEGNRFLDDFPVWEPGLDRKAVRWGIFSGKQLVASVGLRSTEVKLSNGSIRKIGIIGGVATHPEFSGRGLGGVLVSGAVEWAESKDFDILVLWGSEHEFYRKRGFELWGRQLRIPLENLELPTEFGGITRGYTSAIFEQRQKAAFGLEMKAEDVLWYSRHINVEWFTLVKDGLPLAYAGVGRGIDLPGMIHEWGGEPQALKELLAGIRSQNTGLEILANQELLTQYGLKAGTTPPEEFLCMAKFKNDAIAQEAKDLWLWGLDSA